MNTASKAEGTHFRRRWRPDLEPRPKVGVMCRVQQILVGVWGARQRKPLLQLFIAVLRDHELVIGNQGKAMLQLSDGAHEPAALQALFIIHYLHHQQGTTIRDVVNSGE